MKIATERNELPEQILSVIDYFNVFYSAEYEHYEKQNGGVVLYMYNEQFVQVVSIHTIRHVFRVATLLSEPATLHEDYNCTLFLQNFLDDVIEYLEQELNIDWISVAPASSLFKMYPTKSERIKFGNYIIDLSLNEDALFANFNSKHRNMVRRGEKSNVEIRFGGKELLPDYIMLDKETWSRSGKHLDNTTFYHKYVDNLGDRIIIGVAYKDDIPQCGLIGIYNQRMFYYMFGASSNHPEPGSTHYLQWETIKRMKACNVRFYNFVGCRINEDKNSKYHNIQHFKKGFGGTLEECYLFRVIFHKRKKVLFNFLLGLKTGTISSDVIDQEISKWQDINCQKDR